MVSIDHIQQLFVNTFNTWLYFLPGILSCYCFVPLFMILRVRCFEFFFFILNEVIALSLFV